MEERVQKELLSRLLDAHIQWHTRRGIRAGCDCNYCLEKRIATGFIGKTVTPWWMWDSLKGLVPWIAKEGDYGDVGEFLVKWERERKRKIARQWLKEAKEEVL
jgi:hypothetical protein